MHKCFRGVVLELEPAVDPAEDQRHSLERKMQSLSALPCLLRGLGTTPLPPLRLLTKVLKKQQKTADIVPFASSCMETKRVKK
jgi:hypothetical protein